MREHPEKFDFRLGLKIRIDQPATITDPTDDARNLRGIVYVALFSDHTGPLEKGDALKVGETKRTLLQRWRGIASIFGNRKLRPNEKEDRDKFLREAHGKDVYVWMKEADKIEIPYAKGPSPNRFSIRGAEEEFLDEYYEPRLGIRLNGTQ